MTADLFGDKPRRPRRWLMHVVDAGDCCTADSDDAVIVRFKCTRCELETDWQTAENPSAAKRGIPCPNCNEETTPP